MQRKYKRIQENTEKVTEKNMTFTYSLSMQSDGGKFQENEIKSVAWESTGKRMEEIQEKCKRNTTLKSSIGK